MEPSSKPILSIGLPVFNGERYILFALDSLLAQTWNDFEIIISDNASTDDTERICQEYAARDPRIHYYRNETNIGAAANFNRVFLKSRGKYFKWAAADDVISSDFLAKCVQVLDQDPSVILCFTKANRINSSGMIDGAYDYPMRTDSQIPSIRFSDLILTNHFCVAVFGVIRRDILASTPLIGTYVGSDRVLLAQLGLSGKFYEVPEYLFHRRDHPHTSGRMYSVYQRLAWFEPRKKRSVNLVNWNIFLEYIRAAQKAPLPRTERMACYKAIVQWFFKRHLALAEDLKALFIQIVPFSLPLVQNIKRIFTKKINTGGGI